MIAGVHLDRTVLGAESRGPGNRIALVVAGGVAARWAIGIGIGIGIGTREKGTGIGIGTREKGSGIGMGTEVTIGVGILWTEGVVVRPRCRRGEGGG